VAALACTSSKMWCFYLTGTISPDLISFAAAATRVGVRRLRRPIYNASVRCAKCRSLTYVIVVTPNPSRLRWRSRNLRKLFPRRKLRAIWVPRNRGRSLVHGEEIGNLRQTLVRSAGGFRHLRGASRYCRVSNANGWVRTELTLNWSYKRCLSFANVCACDGVYPAFPSTLVGPHFRVFSAPRHLWSRYLIALTIVR
jgi:hypothetical protein